MSHQEGGASPRHRPDACLRRCAGSADWLSRVFGFKERTVARLYPHGGCRTWMEIGDGLGTARLREVTTCTARGLWVA